MTKKELQCTSSGVFGSVVHGSISFCIKLKKKLWELLRVVKQFIIIVVLSSVVQVYDPSLRQMRPQIVTAENLLDVASRAVEFKIVVEPRDDRAPPTMALEGS